MEVIWFVIGLILGGVIIWFASRLKSAAARAELEARIKAGEESQKRLAETFDSLAATALRNNSDSFLQLARQTLDTQVVKAQGDLDLRKQAVENLVKPLKESLDKMEQQRDSAYGGFKAMTESLAKETRNLTQALRTPHVRGRWGESTLRRVVELVGMVEHCDFVEQVSMESEQGIKRPDMVVYLPNQRQVVVDAKAPLDAYLQAIEAGNDESRAAALKRHARQVRERCVDLSGKSYWSSLSCTPEFVVLFLPGEPFLAAALQEDAELLEDAMSKKVILATPATLFCLLSAVSHGWREEKLARNASDISDLARQMHDRIAEWAGHLDKLGSQLEKAVEAYNSSVGSLERRVLVSARKFKDLGAAGEKTLPELPQIDLAVRAAPKVQGVEKEGDVRS